MTKININNKETLFKALNYWYFIISLIPLFLSCPPGDQTSHPSGPLWPPQVATDHPPGLISVPHPALPPEWPLLYLTEPYQLRLVPQYPTPDVLQPSPSVKTGSFFNKSLLTVPSVTPLDSVWHLMGPSLAFPHLLLLIAFMWNLSSPKTGDPSPSFRCLTAKDTTQP